MKPEEWVATLRALEATTPIGRALVDARGAIIESGWGNSDGQAVVSLRVEIPVGNYRDLEPELEAAEQRLSGLADTASRGLAQRITRVFLGPQLLSGDPDPAAPDVPDQVQATIWDPGMLRLFISHVSEHKVEANEVKAALAGYGISAFVAHEDIEPTAEWEDVIEAALRSMDAMLVLLTERFHESHWTDQEVGFAMGLGRPLVPIRVPLSPYGFMGRFQAMRASLSEIPALARSIYDALAGRSDTRERVIDGLVAALEAANTFNAATKASRLLEERGTFEGERASRILATIEDNNQVSGAWNVPERLRRITAVTEQPGSVQARSTLPSDR